MPPNRVVTGSWSEGLHLSGSVLEEPELECLYCTAIIDTSGWPLSFLF